MFLWFVPGQMVVQSTIIQSVDLGKSGMSHLSLRVYHALFSCIICLLIEENSNKGKSLCLQKVVKMHKKDRDENPPSRIEILK